MITALEWVSTAWPPLAHAAIGLDQVCPGCGCFKGEYVYGNDVFPACANEWCELYRITDSEPSRKWAS